MMNTVVDIHATQKQFAHCVASHCLQLFSPHLCDEVLPVLETMVLGSLQDLVVRYHGYVKDLRPLIEAGQCQRLGRRIGSSEKYLTEKHQKRKQTVPGGACLVTHHIHREALRKSFLSLTKDLDLLGSNIIDRLMSSEVLSVSDEDSIRGKETTTKRNKEFFDIIVGRLTLEEFNNILLPAIAEHQPHIAGELQEQLDRLEEEQEDSKCVACRARKYVQIKRLATPLFVKGVIDPTLNSDLRGNGLSASTKWTELRTHVPDAVIIDAMEHRYPDFFKDFKRSQTLSLECSCKASIGCVGQGLTGVLGNALSQTETSVDDRSTNCSRNMADLDKDVDSLAECLSILSFEMEESEQAYKMTSRPRGICLIINNSATKTWAQSDEENLTRVFTKLEFLVKCDRSLTAMTLNRILQKYSGNTDHRKYDAFVCYIIGNCSNDRILCSDGKSVSLADIRVQFNASKCPTLAGKPKLFFVQGKRGSEQIRGLEETDSGDENKVIVADEADFLFGFCTPPSCTSYVHKTRGSLFTNTLTEVLDRQADRHDLLTCLLMVNNEVARRNQGGLHKQVPAPVFTLTKKVNLSTDPAWPHSVHFS